MSSSVTLDTDLMKHAYDCIADSATLMDSKERKDKPETIMYRYAPRYSVTNGVYSKFLKNNGISPDVVDKYTKLEQSWNAAAAKFATEKMKEIIPDALSDKEFMKAAGPKNIKASVNTITKDGKCSVTVNAYNENRNPSAAPGDDQLTKSYGRMEVRHRITKDFDPEFAIKIRSDVEAMLKDKF